jgi:hypothetical protein
MGNKQSTAAIAVDVGVVGALLCLLWYLSGGHGSPNNFTVPPLAETNRVLEREGVRATPEQHSAMRTPEARVRAMRIVTSGTCVRICTSEPRVGQVCGQPATSCDCGRHR